MRFNLGAYNAGVLHVQQAAESNIDGWRGRTVVTEELVERCRKALREVEGVNWNLDLGLDSDVDDIARAIIPIVLEEAAKECDEIKLLRRSHNDHEESLVAAGAGECADAIRSLSSPILTEEG